MERECSKGGRTEKKSLNNFSRKSSVKRPLEGSFLLTFSRDSEISECANRIQVAEDRDK